MLRLKTYPVNLINIGDSSVAEKSLRVRSKKEETREKMKSIIRMAKAQEFDAIEDQFPGDWLRYGKILKSNYWCQERINHKAQSEHLWIYGESHTGKSSVVELLFPNCFYKRPDEWWDGYTNQDVVYMSDMDPPAFQRAGMNNMKVWADPQGFSANKKYGGSEHIMCKKIVFTSNFRIHECMKHDLQGFTNILAALRNRYREVHVTSYLRENGIELRSKRELEYLKSIDNVDYTKVFRCIDKASCPVHITEWSMDDTVDDVMEDLSSQMVEELGREIEAYI